MMVWRRTGATAADGGIAVARGGYMLLEVIIALTIFAIVAVGLAEALQGSIEAANFLTREDAIRRGLEAVMIEARAKPKRGEMALSYRDESLGVDYQTTLEPVQFLNRAGEPVSHLYQLRATARYMVDGKEVSDGVQVYVHRP